MGYDSCKIIFGMHYELRHSLTIRENSYSVHDSSPSNIIEKNASF